MKQYKILVVGCGQLGSRHLQAVASLENISEIHIVDPDNNSLELGKARLKEINDLNQNIKFSWFKELNKNSTNGDLCIVATQAKGRCSLVKEVSEMLHYRNFLIEKIVSQSVAEYEDLLSFCSKRDVLAWVNCKARAYTIHKYVKSKLKPSELITFSAVAGNHGLTNNGIHEVDLFVFHDGATQLKSTGSRIDPILHPSKRGQEIFDLSGSLRGNSEKGSRFVITFADDHDCFDHITINAPSSRFFIDHYRQFFLESYPESDWEWKRIELKEENWLVSHMTKKFAFDILNSGTCELPTLLDCFPAHQFILSELLPHFNQLLHKNYDYCPVT